MNHIVVIENLSEDSFCTVEQVREVFSARRWIKASSDNATITVEEYRLDNELPAQLCRQIDVLTFYEELLKAQPPGTQVIRIRNPFFPMNRLLWTEQCEQFPEKSFQYVLLTADECCFQGFFLERFCLDALLQITLFKKPIMPSGYFNGMSLKESGRQWFSMDLRRFYLDEYFEKLYDSPRWLAVNTIPRCNYRCEKCQYHSPRITRKKEFGPPMPVETFGIILDKCKDYGRLVSIAPTITGEPLLHPEIVKIVSMIKKAGYLCSFATNASLLTRDLSKRLLEAGVDELAFSVDSVNSDTYRGLQGGDLARVERNVLGFQEEMYRQRGTFSGSVICVVSRENENEIEDYRNIWLKRGFAVAFSAEHDVSSNYRPYFSHERWAPRDWMPCFPLWQGLYLTNEGRPVICGLMAKSNGFKENIFSMNPAELWRSMALSKLRRQQLSGRIPGYCRECSCWTGQMSTWLGEDDRLVCHTRGSWLEQPQEAKPLALKETWYRKLRTMICGKATR